MDKPIRRVLTIAGSDSCAGAGVQLDLRVFDHLGVYGMTVITAVTAQNSLGVQKINKVPPRIVAAQIDSVACDLGIEACKIGMLYDPSIVEAVADRIARREITNVVLDPVIAAKDGTLLLSYKGIKRIKRFLLPKVRVITPNVPEAEILSGISISSIEDVKQAAEIIYGMGCSNVLIKGGHLDGSPDDMLFDGEEFTTFPGTRIKGMPVHGTGCAYSAALTVRIALGDTIPAAAEFAKSYVSERIKSAVKLGKGSLLMVFKVDGGQCYD